jgi:hypothetical protein
MGWAKYKHTPIVAPLSPFFTHNAEKICLKFSTNIAPCKKFNAAPEALPSSYYKKDIVSKMSKS